MKKLFPFLIIASVIVACSGPDSGNIKLSVTIPDTLFGDVSDGRLLVFISDNDKAEPRFQARDGYLSQQVFGIDVEGWKQGASQEVDGTVFGYPVQALSELPAGDYYIQALFHKYETFNLATGHTVKLPMDRGEGQNLRTAPGNLYSKPVKITIDPSAKSTINIELTGINPPRDEASETEYIRYFRIKSDLLTEFWGRPMYLAAHVLVPEGFEEHPEARYPLCVFHGHFPAEFGGFRTIPPDADMEPDYIERFSLTGYNIIQQQAAYDFYKKWTSDNYPRMIIIEIQHANPYYDDSYAVNSANLGPYGDAITYELIPAIEKEFRGIGEGWARFLYGGSTGGWEALAAQVFY
ncbi:MAG: hypothetical protein E4G95_06545, partial [Bacteroidia bacterium]